MLQEIFVTNLLKKKLCVYINFSFITSDSDVHPVLLFCTHVVIDIFDWGKHILLKLHKLMQRANSGSVRQSVSTSPQKDYREIC